MRLGFLLAFGYSSDQVRCGIDVPSHHNHFGFHIPIRYILIILIVDSCQGVIKVTGVSCVGSIDVSPLLEQIKIGPAANRWPLMGGIPIGAFMAPVRGNESCLRQWLKNSVQLIEKPHPF